MNRKSTSRRKAPAPRELNPYASILEFIAGLKKLKVTQFACEEFQISFIGDPVGESEDMRQIGFQIEPDLDDDDED